MELKENEIYVRRKQKVYVRVGSRGVTDTLIATYLKNLERLGYLFSVPLVERCRSLSESQFLAFAMPI